jgi:hypothetical protein
MKYTSGWCSGYKYYTLHSEDDLLGYYNASDLHDAIVRRLTGKPKNTINGKTLKEYLTP